MNSIGSEIITETFVYIIGSVLAFIIPVMLFFLVSDNTMQDYIETATIQFTDKARTTGKITEDEYENFISDLDKTGYTFDIEMTHITNNAIPEYDDANNFTGNIIEGVSTYTYQDIMDSIYDNSKDYNMSLGDSLQVTVTCRSDTLGAKMFKTLLRAETQKLYFNYGGFIANNPQES